METRALAIADLDDVRLQVKQSGGVLSVHGLDKFPRMTDYVVPTGVRIADADRVRLGAHLAEGTTVMHEGFCNFNAGTLGTAILRNDIGAVQGVGAAPQHHDDGGVSRLLAKCEAQAGRGQFSNVDNMAFIGILSTQLLWDQLVRSGPRPAELPLKEVKTVVLSGNRSPEEPP